MNKRDFINELYSLLRPLGEAERRDIMRDFEEHFAVGAEKGKTEEQICKELGSPRQVAAQFLTPAQMKESTANPKNRTLNLIVAIILTIVFIAIVPVALGCITASIAILILSVISGVAMSSWIVFGLMFSLSLLLLSLGILIILISIALIRLFWKRSVA